VNSKPNPLIDEFGDEPDFEYTDDQDYFDYQADMEEFFGRNK
jgi:hypothetical protein